MEDVGGRCDGVGAEEEWASCLLGSQDEAPCCGGVAVDVGVDTRTDVLGLDTECRYRSVYVVTVVVSGLYHLGVGLVYSRFLGKLILKQFERAFEGTVEEPAYESESEDVAAFEYRFHIHFAVGECGFCH